MEEWTIDLGPHLVSGVIDNSEKGKTTAQIVINGLDTPLMLELQGNARPDLAGCILKFKSAESWPLYPELIDVVKPDLKHGNVGIITAAKKADRSIGNQDGEIVNLLRFEWFDFSILMRFIFERPGFEIEVDLPRWTLSDDEIGLQEQELRATRDVFVGMWKEFEDDLLEEEEYEEQRAKIEAIMPRLEAAETDKEKYKLMKEALGPDIDEEDLYDLFDMYFGPDDEEMEFCSPVPEPVGLIVLDDEVKTAGKKVSEGAQLLRYRAEQEGAPDVVLDLGNGLIFATTVLLHTSGLLDALPDGRHRYEPYSVLEMLKKELSNCESVIQTLELESGQADKKLHSDSVWELRDSTSELIALIDARKPDEPPPNVERDEDIPF